MTRKFLSFLAVAALAEAVPAEAACPKCDTIVVVRGDQIQCLERRLAAYLQSAQDPILVSLVNCGGPKDGPRLDAPGIVPAIGKGKKPPATEKRAYWLARSDAGCLARELTKRPRKAKEFQWDAARC